MLWLTPSTSITAQTITATLSETDAPDYLDAELALALDDCHRFGYGSFDSVTGLILRSDDDSFSAANWKNIDIELLRAELVEFLIQDAPWRNHATTNPYTGTTCTINRIGNRPVYIAGGDSDANDDARPSTQFYQVLLADRLGVFI